MANKEQWYLNQKVAESVFNKQEVTLLFLEKLTDIYTVKCHLLNYLPVMAQNATAMSLKLSILDTSIDIKAQLLRLDMVRAMLKQEIDIKTKEATNDFNLNSYLAGGLDKGDPYKTDVALLTHLIMIESIQVTTFSIMKLMARSFKNKTIADLIKENLKDSTENMQILDAIMNRSLAN